MIATTNVMTIEIMIVANKGNPTITMKTIEGYRHRLRQGTITVTKDRPVQLLFSPEAMLIQKTHEAVLFGSLVE